MTEARTASQSSRPGYALSELPPPANMPDWAKDLTVSTQARLDQQFLQSLDNFYSQFDGWIQNETTARAVARNGKYTYVQTPFKAAIPRRQAVKWVPNEGTGVPDMGTDTLDADPSILMPVLPPLAPDPPPVQTWPHPVNPVDPAVMFQRVLDAIADLKALILMKA